MQIVIPPESKLEELNHLFIELTAQNCNQRCRECYINFPFSKTVKDFIHIDKIKQALIDTQQEPLECIYLTGAEPMTHPDFNNILRLCLKRTNVCIFTNATFINEKKVRFLKKVENESEYQIIFKLSFASYNEIKNDNVRFRGAFRQNIYALKNLDKYDFASIICVNNYYNDKTDIINDNFKELICNLGLKNSIIQITPWINENSFEENVFVSKSNYDCTKGRLLSSTGVYSCPFLSNDYRGMQGTDFKNYSKSVRLETKFCLNCMKNTEPINSIKIC